MPDPAPVILGDSIEDVSEGLTHGANTDNLILGLVNLGKTMQDYEDVLSEADCP